MPDVKRFVLRIPEDMHAQLMNWAREEERSLHNLLMWIIRRALTDRNH